MRFESGTNALSSVLLSLDDPKDADSLIALMRVTYGAPLLEKQYGFNIQQMVWHDHDNQMSIFVVGKRSTSLTYQPKMLSKEATLSLGNHEAIAPTFVEERSSSD